MVTTKESPLVKAKKYKTRRASIKEGLFWSGRTSFGDRYFSPFAIAVNASNSVVALLSSVGGLLGPISQIYGSKLIEKDSRRNVVRKAVFLEALIWLPLIGIALLFYFDILTSFLPLATFLTFSMFMILSNLSHPAWFSWMGDLVSDNYRGRYFSKRNLMIGFTSFVFAIISSFLLDYFKHKSMTMFGFVLLFGFAFIFRLFSWNTFKKMYCPELKLEKDHYFSFWEFLRNISKNNFGKFAIYRSLVAFSVAITSPLIAIYLLRNLEFSYVTYMVIIMGGHVVSLFTLELWGKLADKYGNYKTISIISLLLPVIPILWIISTNPIYLMLVALFITGVLGGGFVLCSGNFVYDNVSDSRRALTVSYLNILIGVGIFLGAGLGAILIRFWTISLVEPIVAIFIFGSLVRMLVVHLFLLKFKEVRKTKNFDGKKALKNIFRGFKPTLFEEVHQIMSIKKYFSK